MSLPRLLLVDDSEAVLAFEKAALGGHYETTTAVNGREALALVATVRPDLLLLDLSMPEMDGDEVLARMQADPELRPLPVIIVTSERERAQACLRAGARAYLAKPVSAEALLSAVAAVLAEVRREQRHGSLALLPVGVGGLEFALPLSGVTGVLHYLATAPVAAGPDWLCEMFELHGRPVFVLDLAKRLAVAQSREPAERKLVVIEHEGLRLALCVSEVWDPEEIAPDDVEAGESLGGAQLAGLRELLVAVARTSRGALPVIAPGSFLSEELLIALGKLAAEAGLPGAEGR
jgi:CheY-like chemotaxis protein